MNSIQETLSQGRIVLPPCIYVAASGRLVSWNESKQDRMQKNLIQLLTWIINSSMANDTITTNEDINSKDNDLCENCSYNHENIITDINLD